jgi:YesN/AraC family two-component response regulator
VANDVKSSKPVPKPKKILIVDDDVRIRALLKEILSSGPYEVIEAQNGKEGLERVHKEHIDLIITDRSMPVLDGLGLLKALKEEKRQIPTLMISAYGDEDVWAEAIGLGAEDYVLKPFSTESVMKVVEKNLK